MKNRHGVDLDETLRNAEAEGIDLAQISLFYSELTDEQVAELAQHGLFVERTGARVIGRFNAEGVALFPEHISEVYYLGA